MNISKVTTKYQATIPEEIRLSLGIQVGDRIMYKDSNPKKKEAVIKVIASENIVEELEGSLNSSGRIKYVSLSVAREKAGKRLGKKYSG